jgi:uncharacterized SAM-binding protein YcdF (DUF218 family)
LKSFFIPLTEPIGFIWFLMALGVGWLLWRRQWRSAIWLGMPTLLIVLIGSTPLVSWLVTADERPWAVDVNGALRADVVVALGSGQSPSLYEPLKFSMGDASGSRVLAAVELVRQGRAATLVLGGSGPMPANSRINTPTPSQSSIPGYTNAPNLEVPSMLLIQDWLTSWGLASSGVTNLGICMDTHDEAIHFKKLADQCGWKRVILITSALHMKRSLAVFRKQGVDPIPVACDFQVYGVQRSPGFSPFPGQRPFVTLASYLHEKIGWWVYRWRGWI